jgi:2-methylisocitrate lyase-like PEP mutase family enzyme
VGLKAIFMPPSMASDAQMGLMNIGLATASEIINCAKYMAASVNIPLIVGGDDGYGGALASYRTTQELIKIGAAGIYISDRAHNILARTPHNLVPVLSRKEYLGKMGAVLEARDQWIRIALSSPESTPQPPWDTTRWSPGLKLASNWVWM